MKSPHESSDNWHPEAESNHRHADFQSAALPTELSGYYPTDQLIATQSFLSSIE